MAQSRRILMFGVAALLITGIIMPLSAVAEEQPPDDRSRPLEELVRNLADNRMRAFSEYLRQENDARLQTLEENVKQLTAQNVQVLQILSTMQGGNSAPATPNANASPQVQTQSATPNTFDSHQYTQGWVARIYDFPAGFDITSGALPRSEIGSFDATKSAYRASDFRSILGMSINSGILWRGEGFLHVTQGGRYTFAMTIDPTCGGNTRAWCSVYINQKQILSEQGSCSDFSAVGGIDLTPGLHTVDFRMAPGIDSQGKGRGGYDGRASFDFRIKGPSDNKPIPAHSILLRKVGS